MVVTRTGAILAVAAMALALLPWLDSAVGSRRRSVVNALLGILAFASIILWLGPTNLAQGRLPVHAWEQFHYELSAKYYSELRHDGIYVASLQAQSEARPDLPFPPLTRDLRNNALTPTVLLRPHADEVRARFTPERWQSFVRDHDAHLSLIMSQGGPAALEAIRRDHGFNGTPAWIAEARLLGATLPVGDASQQLLACLDVLLLLAMILVVARCHGAQAACLLAIAFGVGHAWDSYWIGGALLRLDWIAALVFASCTARAGRHALTGALIGWATVLRVFPLLFLIGPAIIGLREARSGRPSMLRRTALGFTIALAAGLLAGSLVGRGTQGWIDFAANLRKHAATNMTNNVGLKNLAAYDAEMMSGRFQDSAEHPWGERVEQNIARHRVPLAAAALMLLALAAWACWRARPEEAVALGMLPIFALTAPTCYYWIMLILAVALRRRMAAFVLALAMATRIAASYWGGSDEATFGLMSWALAIGFAAWCLDVVREARRSPSPPDAA